MPAPSVNPSVTGTPPNQETSLSNFTAQVNQGLSDVWDLAESAAAATFTVEQLQDIIAAMFQAGTHTNAVVTYDDAAGTISISAVGGTGGSGGLTQEEVEDVVGSLVQVQGTGISVTYDDPNNVLRIALSGESFTTALKNKLDGIAASATANATNAQLRDRSTHTGTQAISTITGLQSALDAKDGAPFASYASAASFAATSPASVVMIRAFVAGVLTEWKRETGGTCFGGGWVPANMITPLHWGATGVGLVDDRAAIQSALNYLVVSPSNKPNAYNNSAVRVIEGMNRQYAIAGPLYIGNVGNGAGMVYHALLTNLKLVAIAGDWSGNIAPGIPKQMLVVAWRMAESYSDLGAGLFNIKIKNVTLDCRYLTGGIYFENTNSCTFRDSRIGRVGQNRIGYGTGDFKLYSGHPNGFVQGNGALLVDNLNIGGLEEEADEAFPAGLDQISMNTIGMRHHTNDARLNNIIISRVSTAADFDNCGAVQVTNFHPWSRRVNLGPQATNFMFGDCYFDFTPVYITGSFNHYFVACHWILGNAAGGHGLFLVANAANTTGAGLIVSGCSFRGDITVNYTTTGSGTWSAHPQVVLSGNKFDTAPPALREILGNGNVRITSNGALQAIRDDRSFGTSSLAGNFATLGVGRTVAGYAGIELYATTADTPSAVVTQFAAGHLQISNGLSAGEIRLGNSAANRGNSLVIHPNGRIQMPYLPTSAAGLPSGTLYRSNTGALSIVP